MRRAQRGAEKEELLASLELLATWYRDIARVAAGAPARGERRPRRGAGRGRGLAPDRRRCRGGGRALPGGMAGRGGAEREPQLALEALFIRLSDASAGRPHRVTAPGG